MQRAYMLTLKCTNTHTLILHGGRHTHAHAHTHTHTHTHTQTYIHTHTHIHTHTYIRACLRFHFIHLYLPNVGQNII